MCGQLPASPELHIPSPTLGFHGDTFGNIGKTVPHTASYIHL